MAEEPEGRDLATAWMFHVIHTPEKGMTGQICPGPIQVLEVDSKTPPGNSVLPEKGPSM